jgi:cytochrome c peroxidase
MPLHRAAQIPFERPDIVALDTQTHGVHDADKLFGIGISGSRRGPENLFRGLELARLLKIARLFDTSESRRGHQQQRKYGLTHLVLLLICLAGPAPAGSPVPLTDDDFLQFDRDQAALGQLLFYDKILSGNRNIACSTCHHPDFGTSDGLSLGIGEGGAGLGPKRTAGSGDDRIRKRIPRNAPGLWNLGAKAINTLFHDGRLSRADTYGNGFDSPAEEWLPPGLNSILAAQAIFPAAAQFEMAGNPKENEVAGAIHDRIAAAWPILAKRVRIIPAYGEAFVAAFDHIKTAEDVTIAEIANALAAFMAIEWRSIDSPFDAFLAGDSDALNLPQRHGMDLFFGKAGCSECHSGPILSDQEFHALGLPPFGPGRTRPFDPMIRDVGRMGESDNLEDAYRFRTPMLRNVALTAPYGHNGAYPTLEGIIRQHLNPGRALAGWTPDMAALPDAPWLRDIDFVVWQDARELARQAMARDIKPVDLNQSEIDDLVAFMHALTGRTAKQTPFGAPVSVPSGLPVD